jgi:hypothetical protein
MEFDIVKKDMKTRVVNGNVEWEFSSDTAHLWSSILALLLTNINNQITKYNNTPAELRKRPLEHEETRDILRAITSFYNALSLLMTKYKRVVKAMLGTLSLASLFRATSE